MGVSSSGDVASKWSEELILQPRALRRVGRKPLLGATAHLCSQFVWANYDTAPITEVVQQLRVDPIVLPSLMKKASRGLDPINSPSVDLYLAFRFVERRFIRDLNLQLRLQEQCAQVKLMNDRRGFRLSPAILAGASQRFGHGRRP